MKTPQNDFCPREWINRTLWAMKRNSKAWEIYKNNAGNRNCFWRGTNGGFSRKKFFRVAVIDMFKEHEENVVKWRYGDDASSKKEYYQRSLLGEIKWTHESGSTIMKSTIP